MTDPTPHAGDRDVLELLEQAAASLDPPPVPPSDDLGRGRRRLRRRRTAIAAAGLAGAVVVAGGSAALAARSGPAATPAPAAIDTASPTPTPTAPTVPPSPADDRDAQQLLTDDARVVGEYLDPRGTHLDLEVTNVQSSGGGLGTKLGWTNPGQDGLGEVEFFVSDGWNSQSDFYCTRSTPCEDVDLGGVHARRQTLDGVTSIGVEHADGTVVVISADALFGNNSTVAVSGIDVTPSELAHAAADPRLVAPTKRQIAGVDEAFGWPSLPPVGGKLVRRH